MKRNFILFLILFKGCANDPDRKYCSDNMCYEVSKSALPYDDALINCQSKMATLLTTPIPATMAQNFLLLLFTKN